MSTGEGGGGRFRFPEGSKLGGGGPTSPAGGMWNVLGTGSGGGTGTTGGTFGVGRTIGGGRTAGGTYGAG
jgi:hypothetical protein